MAERPLPDFTATSYARNRVFLAAVVVIAIGVFAWTHFGKSPSEVSRLTRLIASRHHDVVCSKVGVMAFAGGRSNLYGCIWSGSTDSAGMPLSTVRRCDVWANGSGYDVTKTARIIFRAQGQRSPC